jgi:hypothetical protein
VPGVLTVLGARNDYEACFSRSGQRLHEPVYVLYHFALGVTFSFASPGADINALWPVVKARSAANQLIVVDIERRTLKQQPAKLSRPLHGGVKRNCGAVGCARQSDVVQCSISRFD